MGTKKIRKEIEKAEPEQMEKTELNKFLEKQELRSKVLGKLVEGINKKKDTSDKE